MNIYQTSSRIRVFAGMIVCAIVLFSGSRWAHGQVDRPHDPVVIKGSSLSPLIGSVMSEWYAFRYNSTDQTWEPIPFQFDDVGSDESYFSENDGLLDNNDEFVVMAKDLGDEATPQIWVPISSTLSHERVKITVTDPLTPSQQGWIYLYRSNIAIDHSSTTYVQRVSGEITSDLYTLGFSPYGLIDKLVLDTPGVTTPVDLVDREKVRASGTISGINYILSEESFVIQSDQYKEGPVRVLREVTLSLEHLSQSMQKSISERYYEGLSVTAGSYGTISSEWGLDYLRQSLDLSSNSSGMLFFNASNTSVPIDGSSDMVNTTLPSTTPGWSLVTGDNGSILQFISLPETIGSNQDLYYHDDATGGTADGTTDTGDDGASFGDIGIRIHQPQAGTYTSGYRRYYLDANETESTANTKLSHVENPLQVTTETQAHQVSGSIDIRVVNPRVNAGTFLWDIELRRPEEGTYPESWFLGDLDLRFNVNTAGFSSDDPVIESLHSALQGNSAYAMSASLNSTQSTVQVSLDHNPSGGGTDWQPPQGTWEFLSTVSLQIVDPTQSSGLTWQEDQTASFTSDTEVLSPTLSGSGDRSLPIELSAFSAQLTSAGVELHWTTSSETDNLGYWIQRADHADGPYQTVNEQLIPGHGNSNSAHDYVYIDTSAPPGSTLYYTLVDVSTNGSETEHGPLRIETAAPQSFQLKQNYPNPFNPETRIPFSLERAGHIQLEVFDVNGKRVRTLSNRPYQAGTHSVVWDGRNDAGALLSNGLYFVTLQSGSQQQTIRVLFLK
jgi:hypothetical protein